MSDDKWSYGQVEETGFVENTDGLGLSVYKTPVYVCEVHGDKCGSDVVSFFYPYPDTEPRVYCYRCIEDLLRKHIKPVKKKEDL